MKQSKVPKRQRTSTIMRRLRIADTKGPDNHLMDDPNYWVNIVFYDATRKVQNNNFCSVFLVKDSLKRPFAVHFSWGSRLEVVPLCDIIRVNITKRDRVAEKARRDAEHKEYLMREARRIARGGAPSGYGTPTQD